jgi:hypothetical protein
MSTSVIALFGAQTDADTAQAELRALGIEEHRIHRNWARNLDDGCRLSVQLPDEETIAVENLLKSVHALDVVRVQDDWPPDKRYGLNYDHNMSLGVSPGCGDAEAGGG